MPADPISPPDSALPADAASDAADAPPRRRMGAVAMAVAAVVGVAAGVGAGAYVAVPLLARRSAAHAAPAVDSAAGTDAVHAPGGPVHLLDNMVLNPAESGAARFLLISVALQLTDEPAETALKSKDAALRDLVLRILGSRSVDQLSDMTQRDLLRARIGAAVDSLAGTKVVTAVYFPQFVIQ
jgi:flagellar FliL protein